ncbi:hypothetical protein [Mesorhizobium sp. M0213]|uniref:hypothetical protein n=1 Tax=Mesorhizobium sp. M0213 TaxID=2956917 RepID=UPI00333BD605
MAKLHLHLLPSYIVSLGVHINMDGRRELAMEIGTLAAEPIWTEFLRKLTRSGRPSDRADQWRDHPERRGLGIFPNPLAIVWLIGALLLEEPAVPTATAETALSVGCGARS